MLVVFVIVEYEISLFLISCNFVIVDNHKSLIFSVSWKRFLAFLVVTYPYVFQINHKPGVSQMAATKMYPNVATFRLNSPRPLWLEIFQRLYSCHAFLYDNKIFPFFLDLVARYQLFLV